MMKPRLLDLFCGAGGAGMGYVEAGFEVVGVDLAPQPRYPFEFHQADALTFPLNGFAVVHASPPCQAFTQMQSMVGTRSLHQDLVGVTRDRLLGSGLPYVMENVPGAPLKDPFVICGVSMGLEVIRHRLFESNVAMEPPACTHEHGGVASGKYVTFYHTRRHAPGRRIPPRRSEREWREAIQCQWMTLRQSRQAVPPAYTKWIGVRLLEVMSCA